jgi:flagellin
MFVSGISSDLAMRLAAYQSQAQQAVDASMARIASGRRFNSFAEDPVAATAEISLRSQQGAANIYLRSTQDAAAAADAASAGLQSASDILTQLHDDVLGLDTSDPSSLTAVQQSVAALTAELTRIGQTTTTTNGTKLLDGSITSDPLTFTVAATGSASDQVQLSAIDVDAAQLGSGSLKLDAIDFTAGTPTAQSDALAAIDAAQAAVTDSLASTGAVSSAMSFNADAIGQQISGLNTGLDNLVDVDAAQESVTLTAAQIREQFAAAMLAQANTLQLSMMQQLLMNS